MSRRRVMLMNAQEVEDMKEWRLLKDYSVPEGKIVSIIDTPTEEEMNGINELFIVAETRTINTDGSDTTVSSSARPILEDYVTAEFQYGRITGDLGNSIGSTGDSRSLSMYVSLINGFLFGLADNSQYAINAIGTVRHTKEFATMPRIAIKNHNGYPYTFGTRIRVYGGGD